MKDELVEKLALIYIQARAAKATPTQIYNLYKEAVEEIRTAESESYNPTL